jgi:ribonuclease J
LLVPIAPALKLKPEQVVMMCTGTQGEPTSIMGRLSTGTNRQFDLQPGDTVILSSHPIPGNEESVHRTINRLFRRGANVIYEPIAQVHVSGHASQEEMKLLLHMVKPKYFIPIHGELRHLQQHKMLAQEVGIPEENIAVVENGQTIEFLNGEMNLGDRIPGGYIFVDGSRVGDVAATNLREREALAKDGVFVVNLLVDKRTGRLLDEPEVLTRGFALEENCDGLLTDARKRIAEVVSRANGNMQQDVQEMLKTFLFNETHRRPTVFVTLSKT